MGLGLRNGVIAVVGRDPIKGRQEAIEGACGCGADREFRKRI